MERKKNAQIKGMINRRRLILSYTIQVIPNILDKVVPEKSLTQIFLCITLEWEMEKSKYGKRRQKWISASWFSFPQYTLKVDTKFEDSGSHRGWEICDRNFDWEKEKRIKGKVRRTHTHCYGKDKNNIPPIYFVYRGQVAKMPANMHIFHATGIYRHLWQIWWQIWHIW